MSSFTESVVEQAALAWLESLGWRVKHGLEIAPGELGAERADYAQVVLEARLRDTLPRLNPELSAEALEDTFRRVTRPEGATLEARSRALHRLLVDGVTAEYRTADGTIRGAQARVLDFDDPDNNDWLAVNQFTVSENKHTRRPDVVLFVNGLPLAVVELKNAADENATIWTAFQQLQTYKSELSTFFAYNELLVISDGLEARLGSLTAIREWFKPWRTIEGEELAPPTLTQLEVLIRGVFDRHRFLDLIRHFIVFEEDFGTLAKKIAGYHQFHAARVALEATVQASSPEGDGRGGVIWHTQGSGKSLTMVFFAGKLVLHPAMANPTIVVITDRNDLDGQLFGVFSRCQELLRQAPAQAEDRANLRELLRVSAGGVVFSTVQKFFPEEKGDAYPLLSDRRNIVVIADEAHRSQYGFIQGFARHIREALPNATFVGFTGTPIEFEDRSTRAVFGDYISVYDVQRAQEDGATVPIFYESRLAKLDLDETERPYLDEDFEEVTEGEEVARKERLKRKWAALEAVVGTERRLELVARDLIQHFEARLEAMDGKAMVVCMSRRICVDLCKAIVALRPSWHAEDDDQGLIKVVMTGSASDPLDWQPHIRNKVRRDRLAHRFRDPSEPFKMVIVRDMWLTGFDARSLHTMYLDKPMRDHGLMQAIARVNRVFQDKPGGLVVDYLGLADNLRKAVATYTQSGGKGDAVLDQDEAVAVMQEKYEICRDLFHGFDYRSAAKSRGPERLNRLLWGREHILSQEEGKEPFLQAVTELSKAFALAVPRQEALRMRDEVRFFQEVKAGLVKLTPRQGRPQEELDLAVRQIVSRAIVPEEVIDVFAAAGLATPDISILSEEFLADVRHIPQKNLAVELLRKLLNEEIRNRARLNLVQSRSFGHMLEDAIRRYKNRAIEAAQVIEELITLAKEMQAAQRRGEELGLSEAELAFYDALGSNDSAVEVLGDQVLRRMARELVETVRRNATIDWTLKQSARANLRRLVKRLLRRHGYPPDQQEKATQTVIEQAELLTAEGVRRLDLRAEPTALPYPAIETVWRKVAEEEDEAS